MKTQYGIRFKEYTANGIKTCTQMIGYSGWTNSKEEAESFLLSKHSWRNNNPEFPELSAWVVVRQIEESISLKEAIQNKFNL